AAGCSSPSDSHQHLFLPQADFDNPGPVSTQISDFGTVAPSVRCPSSCHAGSCFVSFDSARASDGTCDWRTDCPDPRGTRLSLADRAAPRPEPELLQPGPHPGWMTLPSQQLAGHIGPAPQPDSSIAGRSRCR